MGEGVTGLAAQKRETILVEDVRNTPFYIEALPHVRSELAIPLIIKNKLIGVIDIESTHANYFTARALSAPHVVAFRIAIGIENARLYTRVSRQATPLILLNEISRDLSSILNLDELLKRIGEHLTRSSTTRCSASCCSIPRAPSSSTASRCASTKRFRSKQRIPVGEDLSVTLPSIKDRADPRRTKDPRYIKLNPETRSELVVPLIYQGQRHRRARPGTHQRRFFTEDHHAHADDAGRAGRDRHRECSSSTNSHISRNSASSRTSPSPANFQYRLLPGKFPSLANAELAANFNPCASNRRRSVRLSSVPTEPRRNCPNCLGIAVGDVSGKGPAAALYAALVSGFLRSHAADRTRCRRHAFPD